MIIECGKDKSLALLTKMYRRLWRTVAQHKSRLSPKNKVLLYGNEDVFNVLIFKDKFSEEQQEQIGDQTRER